MPYQKTKEGRLVNEITLGDGYPLSNDKQPLKVGGEASILNVSSPTPDGSVDGEVEIKGNLKAKDTAIEGNFSATSIESVPQFKFHSRNNISARLDVEASANQTSSIRIKNNQGYFDIKRLYSTTSLQFTDGTNTPLTLDGNNVEFTNLTDGSITIDSFVDEDNMSSNSATKIPTQQSVKAYVDNEVAGLVDSAPAALDTLNELAAALNDDASFSTTITNSLATKVGLTGDETVAGVKTFSSSIDLTGVSSDPGDDNTVRIGATSGYDTEIFQINSNDGWVKIGPYNESYCHFVTDRPMFYFNQDIAVDTGLISSFNEDLIIRRVFNDTSYNQITLGDDSFELKLDNTARLSVDGDGKVGIGNTSPNHLLHVGDDVTATFTTTPDKAIQLSSSTNDHEIAYILYAGEGTNNIRSKYFVDDDTKHVGWDSTHSTGFQGYEWKYAGTRQMKLSTSGGLTLTHGGWNGITIQNTTNTNGSHLELKNTDRRFQLAVRGNGFDIRDVTASDTSRFFINSSGTASFQDNDITNVGNIALDSISSDAGTSINVTLGTDAGDDFIVDTDTLVVEGDNNRVGIGTTSPDELLHIASETDPTLVLQCPTNNQTNSGTISFRESGTTDRMAIKYNGSTNNLIIDTESVSNAFVLQRADGYIGIGTDSPDTRLHVIGETSIQPVNYAANQDAFLIKGGASNNDSWDGHVGIKMKSNSGGTPYLTLRGTNNDTLNVISSKVGIGTTSPSVELEVNGDIKANELTLDGSSAGIRITNDGGTEIYLEQGTGHAANITSNNAMYLLAGASQKLHFGANNTNSQMSLDDGKLGIGTTSPTTTLDVEGTVSYKHTSLTADSDDLDVSGVTVVECTPSGTDRLGGLTGGVQGQILYILKVDSGLGRVIIEHNEGTGNQDIFLSGGSDVMLSTRGGMTLYCNGTSWFALDK